MRADDENASLIASSAEAERRARTRARLRAGLISLVAAALIFGAKLLAYLQTGSAAILSDALESIVNIAAAGMATFSVWYGSQPADENHPYGHGKIEDFSAGVEGALIVIAAGGIVASSVPRFFEPQPIERMGLGLVLVVVASAANAVLGWFLLREGRRQRSRALEADGRHVLADVITSIGAVIALSVVLLTMVFRSIAVPLKAAAMNLLSIGAAYGVIVAVFQWGWLKGLFGVEETVPIVSFMPMMLFAILFGLSMDYEVFLLSRVREEYLHRRDDVTAVVEGISATARAITCAALIMISVFGAFVLGDDPVIKMFGLGLATAVLIDATLVRIVLVPATMRLLGDRNWWLPGWLDRILPNVDVEGAAGLPEPDLEPGRVPVGTAPSRSGQPEPAPAD